MVADGAENMAFYSFQTIDNKIYLDCGEGYKPFEASEAYMFAPSGYWKTVNKDELFPDDYPTDLLQSMRDGTASKEEKNGVFINANVSDGVYEYYYNFYEKWKKIIVVIEDKKVKEINGIHINHSNDKDVFKFDYNADFMIYFDINQQFREDLPTTLLVQQVDASELAINLTVLRQDESSIPVDVLVTHRSDLFTYLNISNIIDIPTEFVVQRKDKTERPINFVVQQYDESNVYIDLIVVRHDLSELPINFTVYNSVTLPTEFVVRQKDYSSIPTYVNIQRVEKAEFPVTMIVKQNCEWTNFVMQFVVQRNDYSDLRTSVYVIGNGDYKNREYLPDEMPINFEIGEIYCENELPVTMAIKGHSDSELPIKFMVSQYVNSFEQVINIEADDKVYQEKELPVFLAVGVLCDEELPITMYVQQKAMLDTESDGVGRGESHFDISMTVVSCGKEEIPVTMYIDNNTFMEEICNINIHGENELPTKFYVGNKVYNDLDTKLIVTNSNILEGLSSLEHQKYYDNSELPINLVVKSDYQNNDLPITFNVIAKAGKFELLFSGFTQLGTFDVRTKLYVAHTVTEELPVYMNVIKQHNAVLLAEGEISSESYSDVPTFINVVHIKHNELETYLFVTPWGVQNNIVDNIAPTYYDVPTFIGVASIEELPIDFYVSTEKTAPVIETIRNIAKIQHEKVSIPALKDSYNYNLAQTMNYGKKPRLNIANTKTFDKMTTIVGFNLKELKISKKDRSYDYFNYQAIKKAELRFNVESTLSNPATIKVYSVPSKWIETNINYKNAKEFEMTLVTEVPAPKKEGIFTIDITNDFVDYHKSKSTERSYLLAIEDTYKNTEILTMSSLQSAKADSEKPSIVIDYYWTPESCRWEDIPTTMIIRPYIDIPTTFEVVNPQIDDLPTTLTVAKSGEDIREFVVTIDVVQDHVFENLPTTLEVIGYPCDEKGFKIYIGIPRQVKVEELPIEVFVVRHPDKEAYVYVM